MPFDSTKYPENWKTEIRPRILKRDGYKCVFCGVMNNSIGYRDIKKNFVECDLHMQEWAIRNGYKLFRIVISVMHKDHDTWNNSDENLLSACQLHHNRHDSRFRSANKLLNRKGVNQFKIKYVDLMTIGNRVKELKEFYRTLEIEKRSIRESWEKLILKEQREKDIKKLLKAVTRYNVKISIVLFKLNNILSEKYWR